MMGFSPSFFRFLFMAAAAFAVVSTADGALLLLLLLPFAGPVAVAVAGVTDGASACCLGCGCILRKG